jgi:hypothetical protein
MHAVACMRRNWIANCSEANEDLRCSRRCHRNFFGPPWLGSVQASMRLVFSKGNIGLEKAFAAFVPRVSCRGRRYWDWADPSR